MKVYLVFLILGIFLISGCGKSSESVEEVADEVNETSDDELNETVETDLNETIDVNETTDTVEVNDSETEEEEIENLSPSNVKTIELARVGETMMFVPKQLTVSQGTTVRWVNHIGKIGRSDRYSKVSINGYFGKFRSPVLDYNESFEYLCDEKGVIKFSTVPYEAIFRVGTITVE